MKPLAIFALLLMTGCVTTTVHWRTASGGNASALVIGPGAEIEATQERLIIKHPNRTPLEILTGVAVRIAPFVL